MMSAGPQMQVGDQVFDLRLDFFLCPTHGLFVPSRFSDDWTTDEGCPVVVDQGWETCGEQLTAAFLDTLAPGMLPEQLTRARSLLQEAAAAEESAVRAGVVGAFGGEQRVAIHDFLAETKGDRS